MKTIPAFVPKIIEAHTDHNKVFDSLESWANQFPINKIGISTHAHFSCTRCNQKFNIKKQSTCYYSGWQLYYKALMVYKNKKEHDFKEYVSVRTELGDVLEPEELRGLCYKYKNRTYTDYVSWYDPSNRGKLKEERSDYQWVKKYTNYKSYLSIYRNVKTTNERRQYDACTVDENSPLIRGKRSKCNIPNSWDDINHSLSKTWKNKKIKKQWMINIK